MWCARICFCSIHVRNQNEKLISPIRPAGLSIHIRNNGWRPSLIGSIAKSPIMKPFRSLRISSQRSPVSFRMDETMLEPVSLRFRSDSTEKPIPNFRSSSDCTIAHEQKPEKNRRHRRRRCRRHMCILTNENEFEENWVFLAPSNK